MYKRRLKASEMTYAFINTKYSIIIILKHNSAWRILNTIITKISNSNEIFIAIVAHEFITLLYALNMPSTYQIQTLHTET